MTAVKTVLDRDDMRRTLVRIAHEIVEKNAEPRGLAVVGIHRRGALLAARLKQLLDDLLDAEVPQGSLDFQRVGARVTVCGPPTLVVRRAGGGVSLPRRSRRPGTSPTSATTSRPRSSTASTSSSTRSRGAATRPERP